MDKSNFQSDLELLKFIDVKLKGLLKDIEDLEFGTSIRVKIDSDIELKSKRLEGNKVEYDKELENIWEDLKPLLNNLEVAVILNFPELSFKRWAETNMRSLKLDRSNLPAIGDYLSWFQTQIRSHEKFIHFTRIRIEYDNLQKKTREIPDKPRLQIKPFSSVLHDQLTGITQLLQSQLYRIYGHTQHEELNFVVKHDAIIDKIVETVTNQIPDAENPFVSNTKENRTLSERWNEFLKKHADLANDIIKNEFQRQFEEHLEFVRMRENTGNKILTDVEVELDRLQNNDFDDSRIKLLEDRASELHQAFDDIQVKSKHAFGIETNLTNPRKLYLDIENSGDIARVVIKFFQDLQESVVSYIGNDTLNTSRNNNLIQINTLGEQFQNQILLFIQRYHFPRESELMRAFKESIYQIVRSGHIGDKFQDKLVRAGIVRTTNLYQFDQSVYDNCVNELSRDLFTYISEIDSFIGWGRSVDGFAEEYRTYKNIISQSSDSVDTLIILLSRESGDILEAYFYTLDPKFNIKYFQSISSDLYESSPELVRGAILRLKEFVRLLNNYQGSISQFLNSRKHAMEQYNKAFEVFFAANGNNLAVDLLGFYTNYDDDSLLTERFTRLQNELSTPQMQIINEILIRFSQTNLSYKEYAEVDTDFDKWIADKGKEFDESAKGASTSKIMANKQKYENLKKNLLAFKESKDRTASDQIIKDLLETISSLILEEALLEFMYVNPDNYKSDSDKNDFIMSRLRNYKDEIVGIINEFELSNSHIEKFENTIRNDVVSRVESTKNQEYLQQHADLTKIINIVRGDQSKPDSKPLEVVLRNEIERLIRANDVENMAEVKSVRNQILSIKLELYRIAQVFNIATLQGKIRTRNQITNQGDSPIQHYGNSSQATKFVPSSIGIGNLPLQNVNVNAEFGNDIDLADIDYYLKEFFEKLQVNGNLNEVQNTREIQEIDNIYTSIVRVENEFNLSIGNLKNQFMDKRTEQLKLEFKNTNDLGQKISALRHERYKDIQNIGELVDILGQARKSIDESSSFQILMNINMVIPTSLDLYRKFIDDVIKEAKKIKAMSLIQTEVNPDSITTIDELRKKVELIVNIEINLTVSNESVTTVGDAINLFEKYLNNVNTFKELQLTFALPNRENNPILHRLNKCFSNIISKSHQHKLVNVLNNQANLDIELSNYMSARAPQEKIKLTDKDGKDLDNTIFVKFYNLLTFIENTNFHYIGGDGNNVDANYIKSLIKKMATDGDFRNRIVYKRRIILINKSPDEISEALSQVGITRNNGFRTFFAKLIYTSFSN